jgi:hypothetical protein
MVPRRRTRSTGKARSARGHGPAAPVRAPARPGARAEVLLAWALDRDGRKVHAGTLDATGRRARAPFSCLGCGEPLVPHLGRIRARHFAHRPGSACPLTAPETILHLDAKERLLALCADAFARRRAVAVLARCPSCRSVTPRDLALEGDAAVAEGAVGPLRADVLVLRAGLPALALEVKVTHAVDPGKEAALAAAGVPAVEVDAREPWEEAGANGAVAICCVRSLGFPRCPACAARARAEADREKGGEAAEIAELEAYRARGLLGPALVGRLDGTGDRPIEPEERSSLIARFHCPECGARTLLIGGRIARHACAGKSGRPVAWRGYDGKLVELSWWKSGHRGPTGRDGS